MQAPPTNFIWQSTSYNARISQKCIVCTGNSQFVIFGPCHSIHLVCTLILVSNDAIHTFVCTLICSQQFSSYLQLVHSAFAVCNIISCLQEQGFSISSGVVSAVYWKKIADSAISVLTACGFLLCCTRSNMCN